TARSAIAASAFATAFAALATGRRTTFGARFAFRRRHEGLARQLDAVLVVDGDDLDLHLVADLADLIDPVDVADVELADVHEPVAARDDLDERPEILDRRHLAVVDLADLDLLGQRLDLRSSRLGPGRLAVRDVHGAVVLDVDLGAGRFLDPLDRLAARA